MQQFQVMDAPDGVVVGGDFAPECVLELSPTALAAIEAKRLRVAIRRPAARPPVKRLIMRISATHGSISLLIPGDDAIVEFADGTSGLYDIRVARPSRVFIGEGTTSNGVKIICDRSNFRCGRDCMFSDDIIVQAADQHALVDVASGAIINNVHRKVTLGDHVWLGRRSMLLPKAEVGDGSIIGAGAVVSSKIPERAIAAGVPARVVREGVTWSRAPGRLDRFSELYVADAAQAAE